MSQSLSRLMIHIVFSTKNRDPFIIEPVRQELLNYMAGTLRNLGSPVIEINCVSDHVHILCLLSRSLSVADLVKKLKGSSSAWIKTKSPDLNAFYWQAGYGVFSVSESVIDQVTKYIRDQESHHQRFDFQAEYRELLRRHQVEFDERYVWD